MVLARRSCHALQLYVNCHLFHVSSNINLSFSLFFPSSLENLPHVMFIAFDINLRALICLSESFLVGEKKQKKSILSADCITLFMLCALNNSFARVVFFKNRGFLRKTDVGWVFLSLKVNIRGSAKSTSRF